MSEQTIYNALRNGGLTAAGACAMMGNMFCESSLKSNIVETRCPMSGSDYTYNVDNGMIPKEQFVRDTYGYGLCQWTYHTRKADLYDYAKSQNVSIGDAKMQCDFCLFELQRDYGNLFQYLCKTDDLAQAAKLICAEYERPAVNNYSNRINAAQRYYNQLVTVGSEQQQAPEQPKPTESCTVKVRALKRGDLGRDVFLLQCGLIDMGYSCGVPDGDFGKNTRQAVCELQKALNIDQTGTADEAVWKAILGER